MKQAITDGADGRRQKTGSEFMTPETINAMLAEHWPAARVRCTAVEANRARATMTIQDTQIRPGGTISGPTQFAIADSAFWFLVCAVAGKPTPMAVTSELSIRFLRPAQGSEIHAEATLERAGRTQVVATVRVWTDEQTQRPCATAQGTYIRARG
ncbi:MAG: PaaI family thioesterase, partial [Myxococcota bacterium]